MIGPSYLEMLHRRQYHEENEGRKAGKKALCVWSIHQAIEHHAQAVRHLVVAGRCQLLWNELMRDERLGKFKGTRFGIPEPVMLG